MIHCLKSIFFLLQEHNVTVLVYFTWGKVYCTKARSIFTTHHSCLKFHLQRREILWIYLQTKEGSEPDDFILVSAVQWTTSVQLEAICILTLTSSVSIRTATFGEQDDRSCIDWRKALWHMRYEWGTQSMWQACDSHSLPCIALEAGTWSLMYCFTENKHLAEGDVELLWLWSQIYF